MRALISFLHAGAVAYAGAFVLMSAVHLLAPQRDGMLAVSQLLAPHLFLLLLVLVPFAGIFGGRVGRVVVVVAVIIGLVRFAPGMLPLERTDPGDGHQLSVMTWNLGLGQRSRALLLEQLLATDAHVVALQELRPAHATAIEADEEIVRRFPHRVLLPEGWALGIGLLSAHPISTYESGLSPPFISADLELPGGTTVAVTNVHATSPRITVSRALGLPTDYRVGERDRSLRTIRQLVAPALDAGTPLVLLGDFNVTDREPGYRELTDGLIDAHAAIGWGPGSTWRPVRFSFLPLAFLRIDNILVGGPARPRSVDVKCIPYGGDHCILSGVVEIQRPTGA